MYGFPHITVCLCADGESADAADWYSVNAVIAVQGSSHPVRAVCSCVWLAGVLSNCRQLVSR